jgi:copper chaperone
MLELTVTGMTCEHCVKAVTRAVRAVPGAQAVSVDLERGLVAVAGTADADAVRAAIVTEGYGVAR